MAKSTPNLMQKVSHSDHWLKQEPLKNVERWFALCQILKSFKKLLNLVLKHCLHVCVNLHSSTKNCALQSPKKQLLKHTNSTLKAVSFHSLNISTAKRLPCSLKFFTLNKVTISTCLKLRCNTTMVMVNSS